MLFIFLLQDTEDSFFSDKLLQMLKEVRVYSYLSLLGITDARYNALMESNEKSVTRIAKL